MTHWMIMLRWGLDLLWLLFLLVLLRHFWREKQRLKGAQNWFMTKGHITQFSWTQEAHRLWPKIEYHYLIADGDFHGERLFLDTSHVNYNSQQAREVAYQAAMAYERDEDINVYYNPNNPSEAALDITMPRKLIFIVALLISLIILHVGIVLFRLL